MIKFSDMDWIRIAIANAYGLDKVTWQERIQWVHNNEDTLEAVTDIDKPFMYIKAVHAYRQARMGIPASFVMDLDATSSGIQLMGVLMGCKQTCISTNVISNGKRNDAYGLVVEEMNKLLPANKQIGIGSTFTRADVKSAVMTSCYGSIANPKNLFGEGSEELEMFYEAVNIVAPCAFDVMNIIRNCWNPQALNHSWCLPDGYSVVVDVTDTVDKRIEVQEIDGCSFTHRATVNMPSDYGVSLIANVIQSIEAYVCREMICKAHIQGFNIITIFDAFFCSPVHMNQMKQNYNDILADISEMNILERILQEITGSSDLLVKGTLDADEIRANLYALS